MARQHPWMAGAAVIAAAAITAPAVRAQSPAAHKWEVEFHGGAATSTTPAGGSAATLPVGASFAPIPIVQSRRQSSWWFGDGASLLNSVNSTLAPTARITPLDAVIGSAAASRGSGAAVGFRLTRYLGSRYSAELNVDYARTPLRFTGKALDGIEASRSTFITAFRGLFISGPSPNPTVTATATIAEPAGSELLTTGVFGVDLMTRGKLIPYVVAGGGVAIRRRRPTAAWWVPTVFFDSISRAPESAKRTAHDTRRTRTNSPIAVFGGGFAMPRRGAGHSRRRPVFHGRRQARRPGGYEPLCHDLDAGVISSRRRTPSAVFSSSTTVTTSLSGPAFRRCERSRASGFCGLATNMPQGFFAILANSFASQRPA